MFNRSYYRNFNPAVERPNALNQIVRVLLNGALLFALALLTAALIAAWALLFGPPAGPLLLVGVALVGIEAVTLRWPPRVTWREKARAQWRIYASLWGLGALLTVLWAAGAWPSAGRVLFWHWERLGWPGPWCIVFLRGIHTAALTPVGAGFYWTALAFLVVFPIAWPPIFKRLWWRFGTEIVAPTIPDSIHIIPPRLSGVPGIPFIYPQGGASDTAPAVISTSRPREDGDL